MGLIAYLIILAISGLFIGALARLLMPGPDPMSIPATIGLGLAGNIIAGLIVWAIWGSPGGGIVLSVIISMVILYFMRRSRGGAFSRPY
jgi:uncharacterized membrane protein YeaQ/YmgE (transglycosylase-associated protein family)